MCVDDLVQHTIQVRHTLLHTTHWRRLAWLRVCDGSIRVRLGWCPRNTRFIVRRGGGENHDSTSRTLHNELHVNHLGRPPTHLVVEAKRILAGLMRYEIEVLRVPAGMGPRALVLGLQGHTGATLQHLFHDVMCDLPCLVVHIGEHHLLMQHDVIRACDLRQALCQLAVSKPPWGEG